MLPPVKVVIIPDEIADLERELDETERRAASLPPKERRKVIEEIRQTRQRLASVKHFEEIAYGSAAREEGS
jgi:hypothetical protein